MKGTAPAFAALVLAQSSTTIYALFDANLQPFAFPENLPAGTPLVIKAYTDLPMVGGYSTLEVISMEVASLPYLVGSDSDDDLLADVWELRHIGSLDSGALTNLDGSAYSLLQEYCEGTNPLLSGNSPLVAPVEMRLTDLTIPFTGTPRLSVRWPARYASAITVSFDTSSTLSSWRNDPTFSALYTGGGLFTRNITLTSSKFFYRARAHSKP